MNATRFERMTLWISLLLESHALPLRHASWIGFAGLLGNLWHAWIEHNPYISLQINVEARVDLELSKTQQLLRENMRHHDMSTLYGES